MEKKYYKIDFVDKYGFINERNSSLYQEEINCLKAIEEEQKTTDYSTLDKLKEKMFYKGIGWDNNKSKKDNLKKKNEFQKKFEAKILNILSEARLEDSVMLMRDEVIFVCDKNGFFEKDHFANIFTYDGVSDEKSEFEEITGLIEGRDFVLTELKELTIKGENFWYTNIYNKQFSNIVSYDDLSLINDNIANFGKIDGSKKISEDAKKVIKDFSENNEDETFFVEIIDFEKSDEFEEEFGFKLENTYCDILVSDKKIIKNKKNGEYNIKIPYFGKIDIALVKEPSKDKIKNNMIRFLIGKDNDIRLLEKQLINEFIKIKNTFSNLSIVELKTFEMKAKAFISTLLKLKRFNKNEIKSFIFKLDNYEEKTPESLLNDFFNLEYSELKEKIIKSGNIMYIKNKLHCYIDGKIKLLDDTNKKKAFCNVFLENKYKPSLLTGPNWKKIETIFDEQLNDIIIEINEGNSYIINNLVKKPNCWALKDGTTIYYDNEYNKMMYKNVDFVYSNPLPFDKNELEKANTTENRKKVIQLINHLTENNLNDELNKKGKALFNALTIPLLLEEDNIKKSNLVINIIGAPGTGKSTLMNLYQNALGICNVGQANEFDIHEQKINEISNCQALLLDDIKHSTNKLKEKEIKNIKAFIDVLPLTEKTLYKQKRNIKISLTPFILSNILLDLSNVQAMWRRTLYISTTENKIEDANLLGTQKDFESKELAACLLAMLLENITKILPTIKDKNRYETLKILYEFDAQRADKLHLKYSFNEYNGIEIENSTTSIEYSDTISCILDDFNLEYVEQLSFLKFPTFYCKLKALGYNLTKPQLKAELEKHDMKINKLSTNENSKNATSIIMPKNKRIKDSILKEIERCTGINLKTITNDEFEKYYHIEQAQSIKNDLKDAIFE